MKLERTIAANYLARTRRRSAPRADHRPPGARPGDLVLDPFAGSGTTGFVAVNLGRRALLIEQSEAYADLIRERIATAQPPLALEEIA